MLFYILKNRGPQFVRIGVINMITTMLGLKQNMSAAFDQFGRRLPVTTVVADPNVVLKVSQDKIQIGAGIKKRAKKTENAFVKAVGFSPRFIKEVRIVKTESDKILTIGDKVTVAIFEPGDLVKVTGSTKGKGFAGGVKRWGFAGGPKTHGQSDRHRAPGSIGQTTTPGRVFKGKKMAGHMGNSRLTVIDLEVIEVDESKNLLKVKGSVPGAKNGLLIIEKTGKAKGYTPPPQPKEVEEEKEETEIKEAKEPEEPKVQEALTAKSDKPNQKEEGKDARGQN